MMSLLRFVDRMQKGIVYIRTMFLPLTGASWLDNIKIASIVIQVDIAVRTYPNIIFFVNNITACYDVPCEITTGFQF